MLPKWLWHSLLVPLCIAVILQLFLFLTCVPYKLFKDVSPNSDLFFSASIIVHRTGRLFIEGVNKRLKLFFFPLETVSFSAWLGGAVSPILCLPAHVSRNQLPYRLERRGQQPSAIEAIVPFEMLYSHPGDLGMILMVAL